MNDVAIIGGGAAGLAAAVQLARLTSASVVVYEATDKVGRPILRSGNGRCNFSHLPLDVEVYHNADFVAATLSALETWDGTHDGIAGERTDANAVLRFFHSLGLVWRPESDGRLYPAANRASVVLDCLLRQLTDRRVTLDVSTPIRRLVPPHHPDSPWTLEAADGTLQRAQSVLVACGGAITQRLLPDEVAYTEPTPLLGPLRLKPNPFKSVDGQRLRCLLTLRRDGRPLAAEYGELLFRTYGISGIAAMNLSRLIRPGDRLVADFLPGGPDAAAGGDDFGAVTTIQPDEEAIAKTARWLTRRSAEVGEMTAGALTVKALLTGLFSRLMNEVVSHLAGVDESGAPDAQTAQALARVIRRCELRVEGLGPKDACQIHRGGVACAALDPTTLAVRGYPGLFVVGEAVDVDGPCGGYNLHWAWASALSAAHGAMTYLKGGD